jgi:DNA-binding transcriptional LysR family regulator
MNLRQLEVLGAVLRAGSLSAAARSLGISQPAVTKSIRLSEQAAGFTLFRRVHNRFFPSSEALALLPEIERLQGGLAAVQLFIGKLRDSTAGRVTVAAPGSISHEFVTPAIVQFSRKWPGFQIRSHVLPAVRVAEMVLDGQADFGIVNQATDNPYLLSEVLCEGGTICMVKRDHRLARRSEVSVPDLADQPLICYSEDTATGLLVRRALREAGVTRRIDFVVNQSQQALDLVQQGMGVAVIDPFLWAAAPRSELVAIPFNPSYSNRIRVIRARERPRSRPASRLEQLIRQTLRERVASPDHGSSIQITMRAGRR